MTHIGSLHGGCMAGWGEEYAVIPSCAVNKIRNVYSEAGGIYTGFEDVDIDHTEVEAWRDFNDI